MKSTRGLQLSSKQKEPTDEEKMNSVVMEIRILEGTLNELSARQNMLERALIESRAALDAIKGLGEGKVTEVLTQIGGGAMVRSPPPSTEKVLVNVGANVVIEKPREEAVAMLESRSRDVEASVLSIQSQRNEIAERLEVDRQYLQSLLSQAQQS
ncbi:MAG: prefoldin subunit alpha [Nitrososphaerales archaeon]|nr:prefoldin subunit alpha [Nitrososphaerales archaeon]